MPGIDEGEKDKYNCCSWRRVNCSSTTQHVVQLDLSGVVPWGLTWEFNVTMLEPFRQLRDLDLSGNSITGLTRLTTLKNLQSLVMRNSDYYGALQINLGDLTSLKTLILTSLMLNETNLQGIEDLTEL